MEFMTKETEKERKKERIGTIMSLYHRQEIIQGRNLTTRHTISKGYKLRKENPLRGPPNESTIIPH